MRINEMMDEYLLPHPIIEISEVYFGITFYRPDLQKMTVEQRLGKYQEGESVEKTVDKTVGQMLELIKNNPNITQNELSEKIGLGKRCVEKNIKNLKDKKMIKRIGSNKDGHWEILKNN